MDIDELFTHYGTDKGCYAAMYHALFKRTRLLKMRILEVGIGTLNGPHSMVGYVPDWYSPGGSLRAWRDYFPNSEIHGIDVQPDTQFKGEQRIYTHLCDSTDMQAVNRFMQSLGGIPFDIIIDDGSHRPYDQLATLSNLFPFVADGGYYIIEDIWHGGSGFPPSLFDKLRGVCGDSLLFVTEDDAGRKNYLVISRRIVTNAA